MYDKEQTYTYLSPCAASEEKQLDKITSEFQDTKKPYFASFKTNTKGQLVNASKVISRNIQWVHLNKLCIKLEH